MDIILPAKKGPSKRPLILGVLLAFSLGMAAAVTLMKPVLQQTPASLAAAPSVAAPLRPVEDEKDHEFHKAISRLESDIDRYDEAMWLAEELGDRKRYMELVHASAGKNLEADTLWFEWQDHKKKKGLMAEGVKQAVMELPPLSGFNNTDKFKMLSEEHGLSEDVLRALKAEIEILFSDELLEKFGPVPTQDSETVPNGKPA
jgi:hypothetical protein